MPGLPLPTLTAVWRSTVNKFPRKTAVVVDGQRYTYAQLDADIARLAARLQALGVKPGDCVAVAMPNSREFYLAYWAILRCGAILAPVNTRLGTPEMQYVFGNVDPKVIFVHREVWPVVEAAIPIGPHRIGVEVAGAEPFEDALAAGGEPEPVAQETEAVAFIAHTSGTTGQPKGAIMRHVDLLFNIKNTVIPFGWRHEDTHLLLVPLFHATGLYSIVPSSCYLGSTVVVAPRPDPREVIELIARERVTTFLSVPTFHHMVVSLPGIEDYDLSCLRMIGYSGSPMPPRTIIKLRELFPHVRLHNFFGLTETIALTHITPGDCALSHADSIGKVIPDIGMKVLREDGQIAAPNEVGILHIHRECTIRGYWNRPGLLEESITADGEWFNTGDLARVDDDGF
ncbi:MAG: acyl--CoA ligase, partial [Armatimonadetes bacterium]|nr:acyl--CoA ligase [Armatimonadota bacterium]